MQTAREDPSRRCGLRGAGLHPLLHPPQAHCGQRRGRRRVADTQCGHTQEQCVRVHPFVPSQRKGIRGLKRPGARAREHARGATTVAGLCWQSVSQWVVDSWRQTPHGWSSTAVDRPPDSSADWKSCKTVTLKEIAFHQLKESAQSGPLFGVRPPCRTPVEPFGCGRPRHAGFFVQQDRRPSRRAHQSPWLPPQPASHHRHLVQLPQSAAPVLSGPLKRPRGRLPS